MTVHDQLRVIRPERMYAPKSKLLYHIRDFHWMKISPSPATLVLQKNLVEKKLRQCGKDCHILYAIFNTGQKFSVIKFWPMRAGGENFLEPGKYFYVYGMCLIPKKNSHLQYSSLHLECTIACQLKGSETKWANPQMLT